MERENMEEGLLIGRYGPPKETKPSSNGAGDDMSSSPATSSLTPVLVFSTFVAVCGSFCYGCSYSVFGSIMTIGGKVGAILTGKIADLIGLKRTTWFSDVFCTTGWLSIAFAKMKTILRKDGCLAAITERPVDFTDENTWIEMDRNAMTNFHLALADEVLSSIEEKKTAKEIWDHLTKLYEAKSLHNKIFLKRKLYTLCMPESTSVTEHLNTLNTLFSQLTSLSCKIGEQERVELVLQSLPDSYDQLIINLTNSNVTSLVFDDVAAAVLQEENRCKNKEERQVFRGALVVLKGEKIVANLYMLKGKTLLEEKAFVASCSSDSAMRCWVYPIKKKPDVVSTFKNFKARVELDSRNKIKCFRTDNGGEYTSEEFDDFCRKEGIKRQFTVADTPQQNGVAEWMNRTLLERTRAMLRDTDPTTRKVIICRDVIFVEDKLQRKKDDDSTEKSETTQIHVEKDDEQEDSSEAEPTHDEQEPESSKAPTTHQSDRVRRRPNWHSDYVIEGNIAYFLLTEDGEPSTYQERNGDDQVERYRARLVVKRYAQKEGIDFNEIFSPVVRLTTVLVVLAMCAILNLHLEQLEVKTSFLHGNLEEDIYMLQLEGPNKDHIEELKAQLAREFEMKNLGSTNKILGIQIHREKSNRKIWLSQKNYLKKILSRFSMQDLVGSLMFAMICTRPEIAQVVGVVSRYMANPGIEHWNTVKRILRYIKGTSNIALCYRGSNLLINGYVDSDYAGDLDNKSKSTIGYVFKAAGGVVSWVSKLQSVMATSTTEAEYVEATQASKEAIWRCYWRSLGTIKTEITPESHRGSFASANQAKYGREKEFEASLKRLRGDSDISEEAAIIRVGVGLMLLQQLVGAGAVGYYARNIFEEADGIGKRKKEEDEDTKFCLQQAYQVTLAFKF
ncbi:hypothetical protein F3Y22_tig00005974pilonHSYRG00145 [Hibiscus syriacus]|uniref:Integrase catalytic domain-containing protein n=1 Tax=Hibiscus syriacus TaxID=106335 RepID=A0A6A3CHR8_HIBSY|nr:hypothetical protein F3Y22_tig00005974pilonHSYRG00145 [Hibiscus syriacus]